MDVIQNNQYILLKEPKSQKILLLQTGKSWQFGNATIECDSLIGKEFGFVFKVQNGQLTPIDDTHINSCNISNTPQPQCEISKEDADNRKIVDDPNSQKLKQDDINALKEKGISGEDIIDKLIENSATFKDKTAYSQSKYIKKKKQKHSGHIQVLKPNVRLIHEMLYNKSPAKVCMLRGDMLAQLLATSNVQFGSKALVVDTCQGLIVAAVLERLAGAGHLVHVHPGDIANRECVQFVNAAGDAGGLAPLHSLPIRCVSAARERAGLAPAAAAASGQPPPQTHPPHTADAATADAKSAQVAPGGNKRPISSTEEDSSTEASSSNQQKKCKLSAEGRESSEETRTEAAIQLDAEKQCRREARLRDVEATNTLLSNKDFNSLIIVSKYHPTNLVLNLIDFLKPSSSLCIFSPFREVLTDCFSKLRDRGGVINMRLTENWYREYQMLPERSHPNINMNSSGGYLLTGITVDSLRPSKKTIPATTGDDQQQPEQNSTNM